MSDTVWIKHAETGAVAEVPADALPMYRQSNWDVLTKKEIGERDQAQADDTARSEAEMRALADKALGATPPPAPPPSDPPHSDDDTSSDATGRQAKKGNG